MPRLKSDPRKAAHGVEIGSGVPIWPDRLAGNPLARILFWVVQVVGSFWFVIGCGQALTKTR